MTPWNENSLDTSPPANWLYLALWFFFPILVPFHVLGSDESAPLQVSDGGSVQQLPAKTAGGVPQPADYFMVALIGMTALGIGPRLLARLTPAVRALARFLAYLVFVSACWACLLGDAKMMKSSLFYTYDFLLFLTFLVLYSQFGDRLLRVTVYAVAASVFIQVAASFVVRSPTIRQVLFFKNPNQFGYYAVLAASLFYVCTRRLRVRPALQVCFYLAAAYLTALSLSKAASAGMILLVILVLWDRPAILLGGALVVATAFAAGETTGLIDKVVQRLEKTDTDDSMAARGYDRIFHHPQYLVFGAGEGESDRFYSAHAGELHSTLGTIFFSYGVIGAGLFALAILAIIRTASLKTALGLLPVFLYGAAHQGLRTNLLWVLFALVCCLDERSGVPTQETGPLPDS